MASMVAVLLRSRVAEENDLRLSIVLIEKTVCTWKIAYLGFEMLLTSAARRWCFLRKLPHTRTLAALFTDRLPCVYLSLCTLFYWLIEYRHTRLSHVDTSHSRWRCLQRSKIRRISSVQDVRADRSSSMGKRLFQRHQRAKVVAKAFNTRLS